MFLSSSLFFPGSLDSSTWDCQTASLSRPVCVRASDRGPSCSSCRWWWATCQKFIVKQARHVSMPPNAYCRIKTHTQQNAFKSLCLRGGWRSFLQKVLETISPSFAGVCGVCRVKKRRRVLYSGGASGRCEASLSLAAICTS